jgi:aspartyl/asparaginyl beta-hydroxylase (cupin superfamily)
MSVSHTDEEALDRRLAAEPRSISAHVSMGDFRARVGKEDLAAYYYREALRLAECQPLTDEGAAQVDHARAALNEIEERAQAERETRLRQRNLPPESWSPRLRQALELAAGRKKLYRSEPTHFRYPGLPDIQYFDAAQFEWVPAIEAATESVRDELLKELERGPGDFRAYLNAHSTTSEANQALLGKRDWSVLSLCENGWVTPNIVERFPRTWAAVQQAPVPAIFGWGPTVVLSLLKAGARIPPHNGMFNTRLICHLPLIVPPGCGFRVGNEVREWEEGKLLIFDDTIEHEAWNNSDQDRVVLIFDIWRPELTGQEREELLALFHQ